MPEQRKDTKAALSIFDKQPYAGIVILHGGRPDKNYCMEDDNQSTDAGGDVNGAREHTTYTIYPSGGLWQGYIMRNIFHSDREKPQLQ